MKEMKNPAKAVIYVAALLVLTTLLTYIFMAYVIWEWDVSLWSTNQRMGSIFIPITLLFFSPMIVTEIIQKLEQD